MGNTTTGYPALGETPQQATLHCGKGHNGLPCLMENTATGYPALRETPWQVTLSWPGGAGYPELARRGEVVVVLQCLRVDSEVVLTLQ